jgi:hypothetical protein
VREEAARQVGDVVAQINNMKTSVPMFSNAANSAAMHAAGLRSTDQNLQIVQEKTRETITRVVTAPDGSQQQVQAANPNYDPSIARFMQQHIQEQTSRRPDPNDPNNYGQAA